MQEASLNFWTIGFLFFSGLGLLLSLLMVIQALAQLRTRWPIIAVLLLFSLTIFDYVLIWTGKVNAFPYLNPYVGQFYFAYGPLFWVWHRKISNSPKTVGFTLLHFSPFLIAMAGCLPLSLGWVEPWQNPGMLTALERGYITYFQFQPWVVILHMLTYAGLLFRFQGIFKGFPILLRWVRMLNFFFVGFALAFLSYYVLVKLGLLKLEWDYMICISMCLFILGIQVIAYLSPKWLNGQIPKLSAEALPAKYANSPVGGNLGKRMAAELQQKVKETAIWRKSDVGLDDLAQLIGQPRQYVSQILNEQLGQNFYEYINGLRIEEARELLLHPQHRQSPVLDIAFATGFNNKVSFYRTFKNRFGVTPTEFRELNGVV